MSTYQTQAVWELCRQGFPLAAEEAEKRWEKGQVYRPGSDIRLPRRVRTLIDQCNWEIDLDRYGRAGIAVLAHAPAMPR